MPSPEDFVIPAVLRDLEGDPYNLQPYPNDFDDADDVARTESFQRLVDAVRGKNNLLTGGAYPDDIAEDDEDDSGEDDDVVDRWLDRSHIQALYTLVRKCTSLTAETRQNLLETLCQSVTLLIRILHKATTTVSPACRDAFGFHLYMLYSAMFLLESQVQADAMTNQGAGNNNASAKVDTTMVEQRATCVETLYTATVAMDESRNNIWQRGVVDEQVVLLPCKMAYLLLERSTGVVARRTFSAVRAMDILTWTVQAHHAGSLLTHVVASVWDLLHSHEHMAALTAEILGRSSSANTTGAHLLAQEMLREYGRLDGSGDPKTTGVKVVAPWVSYLAEERPAWMLPHLSHLVAHLRAEAYQLRSAVVTALAAILVPQQSATEGASSQQLTDEEQVRAEEATPTTTLSSQTREQILLHLETQVHDVSSYTRSAVLKAWSRLVVTHGALPKRWMLRVTQLALERLSDKTVVVRKQAMQLLTNLLEHNPFGGNLDPQAYRVKLKELYTFVQTNLPSHIREAQEMACAEAQDDEQALHEIEAATLSTVLAEFAEDGTTSEDVEVSEEFRTKIQATRFTQSALDFIDAVEGATSALDGMLLSANTSDVTEALRFFVQARHFALPCAVTGMKRALALMWSTEVAIRDEVLKAFVEVFIAQPGSEGATFMSDHQIAKNLMVLTAQATVSELASIEEALGRLVREERIPADVFLILWSIASKGSGEARTVALQLIAMGAAADRSLVDSKSRLKLLLDASLGDYMQEHHDWALAAAGATVLQRVSRGKVDPTDAKYLVLERTMTELCAVARGDICRDESEADTRRWFSASEQAIKALFVLSPHPETDCAEIVRGMQASVFGTDSCPTLRLARFFHVLGQTALHLLVYTESLSAGVRRGNAKRALYKQESADKAKAQSQGNADADDAMEAELGMAAELEAENERQIADISENEILGRGLISAFGPLLVRVVGNEGNKFESEILRQSSTLALCKFMCVSSTFCEQHLPLLFTALSNAPSEDITMRANTVVALGDLAFRFPNEVEPYTPRIYSCLRDPSTKVRRHTMMVLTHLILNDMVKVKGNVCEIALCLRDEDPRIRDTARLLFHELSKRSNNPVYNLLPDIVSQLSQRPNARDDFRSIMSFLLGYIKKERQNDMLMEKFLQRFEKCSTVSQKADLAYCLTLLKVSEKSIKYLSENFKLYKDALFDADVRKSFSGIVTKAKKALKPELRQFVEEWEAQLNEMATAGAENEEADAQAGKALAKARRRANRKQGGQLVAIVEDNVVEEEESTEVTNATPSPRKQRASRKISPVLEEESSGDDMEFDDSNSVEMESLEQPPQSTRKPSRRVIAD